MFFEEKKGMQKTKTFRPPVFYTQNRVSESVSKKFYDSLSLPSALSETLSCVSRFYTISSSMVCNRITAIIANVREKSIGMLRIFSERWSSARNGIKTGSVKPTNMNINPLSSSCMNHERMARRKSMI